MSQETSKEVLPLSEPAESTPPITKKEESEKEEKKETPKKVTKKKEPTKKKEKKEKKEKPLSKLARKKQDDRYFLNGKGRLVSKKKSENGKRNVQSRAIKIARKLLGLEGRMILLGRGAEGKALIRLTKNIREALKEGKEDEAVSILFANVASQFLEEEKKAEEEEGPMLAPYLKSQEGQMGEEKK